ncbi:MAG TPA: AAA family ATPase [Mycobacteriales bacterium]|nr:AAA family ATPase [Mycobacteriales bacterium]
MPPEDSRNQSDPARRPVVVLISGIQGTGKTTLARAVAQQIQACVFSRDPFMRALLDNGMPIGGLPESGIPTVPVLGHAMLTVILEQRLQLGASVVLECIMSADIIRTWNELGQAHDAHCITVECICSDRRLHRERVENRYRAGESEITWDIAGRAPDGYRVIPDADYVADAVLPTATHAAAIAAIVRQATGEAR